MQTANEWIRLNVPTLYDMRETEKKLIKIARERAEKIRNARAEHAIRTATVGWTIIDGQLHVWKRKDNEQ